MTDYVLEGPRWGSTASGTVATIVTWAVDATVPASFLSLLSSAFADWAQYANIQFQQVASTAIAEIDFSLGAIDGLDNILGETSYSYSGSGFTSATVEFDSGEGWHATASGINRAAGWPIVTIIRCFKVGSRHVSQRAPTPEVDPGNRTKR